MNKNGFTLVELLAVVIIIAIVITLLFPSVTDILNKSKNTVRDTQINRILDAAYDYTLKNTNYLPEYGDTNYITLNDLKKHNLIDSDIREATTNKKFEENLVISIRNVGKVHNNTSEYSKKSGDYLYTVELDFMNTDDFNTKKPTIVFEGYNTNPIVVNLNIGDMYNPLNYTASSYDSVDLTSKVIENIIYNSKRSDAVDTSSSGIYYINYSVVDSKGYSNYATVNVIISDNEKPLLNIPENVTITRDTNSYKLMDGVSCKDNSGICDINIVGNIEFGVSGKYIIEYVASDPSGNTTILKRVITVE